MTAWRTLADSLVRSHLLPAEQVQRLCQRWNSEGGSAGDDPAAFTRWLVTEQQLTKFQAALFMQGKTEYFFLGEYKLLDRIGKGRMAGIYLARHRLGHTVAIKVLPPSKVSDPVAMGRFRREARLARRLKHPNVVRTFHSGRHGDLLYYIVMEYLEGETLDEVLKRRGRLPTGEAGRLLDQALSALQFIHEQGMVHRDLKPANLMIVPAPAPGQPDTTWQSKVKVLDIGLGRELFNDEGLDVFGEQQLTVGEALLGDPTYMAPEQARDAHKADIRSDIYTLGCVLFECLTGQPPFADKTPARLVLRHTTEPPPQLRTLLPQVPPGLQPVLDRMLAKSPADRFQTPAEVAAALAAALKDDEGPRRRTAVDEIPDEYLKWLETTNDEDDAPPSTPGLRQTIDSRGDRSTVQRNPQRNTAVVPSEEEAPAEDDRQPLFWVGLVAGIVAVAAILGAGLAFVILKLL